MTTHASSESRHRTESELLEILSRNAAAREALGRLLHKRASASEAAAAAVAAPVAEPVPESVPKSFPESVHGAAAPDQAAARMQPVSARADALTFSFIFFAGSSGRDAAEKYDLLHEVARFGDEHGFEAIWIPERHFHPFGGIYSSPVVIAASLAKQTTRIRLRAGSVVLPLHHPVTVTESWAMVDQLSGGRVDLAFASGWNPNDFVTAPEVFPRLREEWLERIDTVRHLWRGNEIVLPNGKGEPCPIAIFPRPMQPELNVWLTVTSRDDSFVAAGRGGFNVLTMLKGISVEELGRKIALYREARAAAGHDRAAGIVTLMLHTLVHPDRDWVRQRTAESFGDYIKTGLSGHVQAVGSSERPDEDATRKIVEYAAERYSQRAALFGTVDDCRAMADAVQAVGVNEIALLMDFGVDAASVKDSLPHVLDLKRAYDPPGTHASVSASAAAVTPAPSPVRADVAPERRWTSEPIAVVGMSGRFPGSSDVDAFWTHLRDGHELITDIPAQRRDIGPEFAIGRAGLLDDIDTFDAAAFRITNREASSMDPHQRLFLTAVRDALDAAGRAPETLSGSRTGVFVAAYNTDFTVRAATGRVPLDAYTSTGTSLFMVANRVSHAFDLRGPSEVINTACSSALVAIHRAVQALRAGECEMAIAGGVSLLISMGRLAGLDQYGILSREGRCRPFDAHTTGQVIGEGVGALVLKTLRAAEHAGDAILGVIRGSAVNHHGNRSGSPTLPDVHAQADTVLDACRDAGLGFDEIDYIEAHGTGGFGDIVELEAFKRADELTRAAGGARRAPESCGIGTLKPNIGFLEAAGGVSQAIKVLQMFEHETLPPTLNHERCPEDVELHTSPFRIVTRATAWTPRSGADGRTLPRRASVHAYGLGGTNAHIVFEEYVPPAGKTRRPARTPRVAAPSRQADEAMSLVREIRIAPDAPVVADHRVHGCGVVPAVAYLDLAAEACRAHLSATPWRFEDVFWIAPCFVRRETTLRCTAKVIATGSLFFEVIEHDADGDTLLATGHIVAGATSRAVPRDESSNPTHSATDREVVLAGPEIYNGRTARPVAYGPAFRAIVSARIERDEVHAMLERPRGESADASISRGLLEGAFQAAQLLGDGEATADVFMPFSVGSIEVFERTVPERCHAVVSSSAGAREPDAGRFDAVLYADGRAWIRITNFCARRGRSSADAATPEAHAPAPNEGRTSDARSDSASSREAGIVNDAERTLADLAAGRVSVEEAARLLSASTAASNAAAEDTVAGKLRAILTHGGRQDSAGRLDVRARDDGRVEVTLPAGTVSLAREDAAGLVEGRLDPGDLTLLGRLHFDPPDDLFVRDVGDALFRHYNATHCAHAGTPDVIAEIYRSGVVRADSGETRAIYPWAVPAAVGIALAHLIRTRRCTRTLEIGMAYGLATLFACRAHREAGGGHHTAIDPHQRLEFLGIGLSNVGRAGLSPLLTFIEEEDATALPDLERRGERFDLVFIDGLHMFDYTLLDFFYADRLLAVGGCIAFDDAQTPGVQRAIAFIRENREYRPIDVGIARLVVLEKIDADKRSLVNPNHFRPF